MCKDLEEVHVDDYHKRQVSNREVEVGEYWWYAKELEDGEVFQVGWAERYKNIPTELTIKKQNGRKVNCYLVECKYLTREHQCDGKWGIYQCTYRRF